MLLTKIFNPFLHQVRVCHGGAAHGNHCGSATQCRLKVRCGLDAASEINRQVRVVGDCLQNWVVHYVLAACSVQVNQMESFDAGILKAQGYVQRAVAVGLLCVVVTLGQAYALAVNYIYSRYYLHNLDVKKILKNTLSCGTAFLRVELGGVEVVLMQ